MSVRCIVCGKPLRDPASIARGMGRKCAGLASSSSSYRSGYSASRKSSYSSVGARSAAVRPFPFVEDHRDNVPETLRRYPADLVELVLSAPESGSIASRIKLYSRHGHSTNGIHPAKLIKQIRRVCIECRLSFWPGMFQNLKPIPCIPCGENDWRLGENGKICSKDELVSYLTRYGIISPQLTE